MFEAVLKPTALFFCVHHRWRHQRFLLILRVYPPPLPNPASPLPPHPAPSPPTPFARSPSPASLSSHVKCESETVGDRRQESSSKTEFIVLNRKEVLAGQDRGGMKRIHFPLDWQAESLESGAEVTFSWKLGMISEVCCGYRGSARWTGLYVFESSRARDVQLLLQPYQRQTFYCAVVFVLRRG